MRSDNHPVTGAPIAQPMNYAPVNAAAPARGELAQQGADQHARRDTRDDDRVVQQADDGDRGLPSGGGWRAGHPVAPGGTGITLLDLRPVADNPPDAGSV
ncbi:MAG: hypothetical protein RJQ21_16160, partial [Rhodospirillales bacterium]